MDHRLTKIGVGYDGSAESEHALATARELAGRHTGCPLLVRPRAGAILETDAPTAPATAREPRPAVTVAP